jgi:hypothetical protein
VLNAGEFLQKREDARLEVDQTGDFIRVNAVLAVLLDPWV